MSPLGRPNGEYRSAQHEGTPMSSDIASAPDAPVPAAVSPRRASAAFMRGDMAHWIALGFGSGLSPIAPGTVGSLWGWLSFLVLDHWLSTAAMGWLIAVGLVVGTWVCTRTARHMGVADPGAIVWDEVLAMWIVLWLLTPASGWLQFAAFALFRYFDAVKPGPVGWADGLFKLRAGQLIGWRQGFGIMFDDLVAALCTLLVLAMGKTLWTW